MRQFIATYCVFFIMLRGKKLVKMCQTVKNSESANHTSNTIKTTRKSNWFCNRGFTPPPVNVCDAVVRKCEDSSNIVTESTTTTDGRCSNENKEITWGLKNIIINDIKILKPFKQIEKTTTKSRKDSVKEIVNEEHLIESENELIPETPPDPYLASDDDDSTYKPSDNKEIENEKHLNESENELIPETPPDPYLASDDDDSTYEPSDNENGFKRPIRATPVVTRTTKLKFQNRLSKISNSDLPKVSQNEIVNSSIVLQDLESPPIIQNNDLVKTLLPNKKGSTSKVIYKRKPDFCYYCETEVLNFARHLSRNHSTEIAVAEILSKPPKSKERKQLIDKIRRKGNYLANPSKCFKAVRQTNLRDRYLLPCDNCLGYFSSKLLYRHRKKCYPSTGDAQIAGQAKLLNNSNIPRQLKDQVFPRMRPDKISMEAKLDFLICQFGARYLNTHRDKHFINVTSRKMRELSKILIEVRKLEPTITTLISALKPHNFDLFIEATKRLANYDNQTDTYASPTYAMNIATSLKQCCDIAINYAYKKNTCLSISSAEIEANLKTLIHLFDTNWKYEISSQAANTININKWNKVTLVPLASDLKLLRQYLLQAAEDALKNLDENKDHDKLSKAYNTLTETIYCRVILLNRKRSGELQRMQLNTYINSSFDKKQYEEFNKAVSLTEQILLSSLKRVVIRGKRGRGVPVLFSTDVQNHIEVLLKAREKFVPKENPYLFAKPNSLTPIIGYKILSKFSKLCGAKNPQSITSTRLRKHLATLSQLFNLNEGEIEQLSTFMGHTSGIHRNNYRLPDDVYQTAKISKLLMLMEKGCADEYQGKTLDEINIDMEENLLRDNEVLESDDDNCLTQNNEESFSFDNASIPSTSTTTDIVDLPIAKNKKGKKSQVVIPWTTEQKRVVKLFFQAHIKNRKPPKKKECEEVKSKYSALLENKNWVKIKAFIHNEYSKKKQ